jgi:flagellar hook-length control protein FliK
VNVTPPISGVVTAHGASPALPKNLSLADLLFADSRANAASDFKVIAATLFGVEGSTQPQSPAKSAINGKKLAAGLSEEKPKTPKDREISDPAFSGAPAELLIPLQNIPAPLIQVSAKPDSNDKQLGASAIDRVPQLRVGEPPAQAQTNSDTAANLPGLPDDHILPSALGDKDTPLVQPAADNAPESGKGVVSPIAVPANGAVRKKDAEPSKAPADHSQSPVVPQVSKQLSPPLATTDRAKQSTDSNFSVAQAKPSVAINALPPTPPVEQIPDPSPDRVLESVVATKAVPQSGLANPATVTGPKSASGRNASNTPPRIKSRDTKDSRIIPPTNGKPGFIQATQTLGRPNTAGSDKDSPGFPLSGHSGAHGKPAPLKLSVDAPSSPASLADADGPDETLPASASSPVTAKLVQGMSQSEFRVGMQSQEFGNIDIRTSVARHMFSAQISVEHSDVAKSLTAQLPGLYHRLADQQVAVGNIVIHGQSLGTSSGLAQDAQRQSWQPQGHSADTSTAKLNTDPILPVMTEGIDSAGRLDIRI